MPAPSVSSLPHLRGPTTPIRQVSIVFLALALVMSSKGDPVDVYASVGENVTFTFPGQNKTLDHLYFQKCTPSCNEEQGSTFVNGFYQHQNVKGRISKEFQNRSSFVRPSLTVTILGVKVSDKGHYKWTHGDMTTESYINLHVSASYKTPTAMVQGCSPAHKYHEGGFGDGGGLDEAGLPASGCFVACRSHGGYPKRKVEWGGTPTGNSTRFKVLNDSQEEEPHTLLFSASSRAWVSCSEGPQRLSCSVGDSTAAPVHVCESKEQSAPPQAAIITVIVLLLFIIGVGVTIIICKGRTDKQDNAASERNAGTDEALSLQQSHTHQDT